MTINECLNTIQRQNIDKNILNNLMMNQRFLTKEENKEFKKVYCYISRTLIHNNNKYFLHHKIAEAIWRRNKSFEEMYSDIKKLLNF